MSRSILLAPWVVVSIMISGAQAQGNYEVQVYGAGLVPRANTMVEFHTNFTPRGPLVVDPAVQPDEHALHETLEVTHGFTDWLEVGGYLFMSGRSGDGWQWVGDHIRPRLSVPERWRWPVGVSLSQEFGYQRSNFSQDTWTWEIRPIVDMELDRVYWAVNFAFGRSFRGPGSGQGFDCSPSAKVSVKIDKRVDAGLEYYGGLGFLRHLDPLESQTHQVFPTVDLNFGPDWEFNAGVGIGLTDATSRWFVKVIVGRRLPF
jgi:hypothetical protein